MNFLQVIKYVALLIRSVAEACHLICMYISDYLSLIRNVYKKRHFCFHWRIVIDRMFQ